MVDNDTGNTGNPSTPTIPDGFELISKEKLQVLASAGNDLKKLKSTLEEAGITDVSQIKEMLLQHQHASKTLADQQGDLVQKLEATTLQLKTERDRLKQENKAMKIWNDVTKAKDAFLTHFKDQIVASRKAPYLADVFFDQAGLHELNPDDPTYETQLGQLVQRAWEAQEQVVNAVAPVRETPAQGLQVGGGIRSGGSPNPTPSIASEMAGIGAGAFLQNFTMKPNVS